MNRGTHVMNALVSVALAAMMTLQVEAAAMLAYGRSIDSTPRCRIWDGTAWGSELLANSVGSGPQWLVLRASPLLNEFALATLDSSEDVEVQIWTGSAWSAVFQATNDADDDSTRVFDLAYEQLSGHLLLVYREAGTSSVRYRTYNGTTWSGESSYTMTGGDLRWLQLIPKTDSDEIMLIALGEQNNNLSRAAMWNGSSFSNQTLLPTDDDGVQEQKEHADGAFESISGQALAAYYQDSNLPGYRTLTGGSWSSSLNAPSIGGETRWMRLASDSVSDEIIMLTLDNKRDINLTVWSGSAWGSPFQVEGKTGDTRARGMDAAYEPEGNQALVVYDDNTSTLKYRMWDGFGWSSELPGPTGGTGPLWNPQAVTGIGAGQVFVTYQTNAREIRTVVWGGSSFGSSLVLGTSSASQEEYETFMVAVANPSGLPKITSWQEVKP